MKRTLWRWAAPVAVLATVAVWGWAQERKPTPRDQPATQELPPTADNAPANDPPFLTPKPTWASRVVAVMDSSGKRHRMYVPKDALIGATLSVQEGSDARQVYTVVADPDAPKEFNFSRSAVSSMSGGDAVYPGVVEPGLPGTSIYNPGIPRQNVNSTIAIGPPMKQKTRSRSVTETYLEPFTNDEIVEIQATQEAMTTLRSDKSENEKAAAKRQLTEIMIKGFERDLDSREKEVAELEAGVKKLREQLEKRKAAKDKIIELRMTQIEYEIDGLGFPGLPLSLPDAGAGLTPTPVGETYGRYAPNPNALPGSRPAPSFDPNDNAPAYQPGIRIVDPARLPVPTRSNSNRDPDEFRPTSPNPMNNIPTDDGLPPEGESPLKPSPPFDDDSNTDSNAPAGTAPAATSSVTPGSLPAEAPGVSQPSRNLLLNSTFEDGPNQWSSGQTPPTVEYTIDPTGGVEETKAAKIKKTDDRYFPISEWTYRLNHDSDIAAQYIELSAMVKTKDATKAVLDVLFLDDKDEWIKHEWAAYIGDQSNDPQPLTHDFRQYKGTVAIPPNTKTIVIGLQDYGPGEVWFDDVSAVYLNELPKEPNNVPK